MEIGTYITACGELWGALLCLLAFFVMLIYRNRTPKDRCVRQMLLLCMLFLLSDAVTWIFDGRPGNDIRIFLYISNYTLYVCGYLIIACFIWYVWQMVRREGEKVPALFKVFWAVVVIFLAVLVIGAFSNFYFYYDDANVYHRTDNYVFSQIICIMGVITLAWATEKYKSRFTRLEKVAAYSYFILPTAGTIVQLYLYGFGFQPFAFGIATLITFFVRQADIREELVKASEREQEGKAELQKALVDADASSRAKSSFLFNMSHDIRTPMNAIIGYTDMIEKHFDDREKCVDYLNKIHSSGEFLLSLINNVLELARIESGKAELDETICDTSCVQDAIVDIFAEMMEQKHIEFVRSIDVHTPYVWGDRVKLNEIFLNLVSNAYKYTPEGGRIEMRLKEVPCEKPGWINMQTTLSDNGIGMSAEFLPTLFEEFTRERNMTESRIQGTGLGMPIVKKLVDLMGGTITVESELGKGTTFVVTIPNRIAEEAVNGEEDAVQDDPDRFIGKRILMAEDNDLNAEIAAEILGEVGFEVERAADGIICVDMLRKAENGYYDVILMDIQMPNMDGYKATRVIRSMSEPEKNRIPIIAMTANAFEEDRKNALDAGMNGHLAKPIDVPKLMQELAKVLR